jgi:hypothetical protein
MRPSDPIQPSSANSRDLSTTVTNAPVPLIYAPRSLQLFSFWHDGSVQQTLMRDSSATTATPLPLTFGAHGTNPRAAMTGSGRTLAAELS